METSSAKWPGSQHWPSLAQEYDIQYRGQKVTESSIVDNILAANSTAELDEYLASTFNLESIVNANFLKIQVSKKNPLSHSIKRWARKKAYNVD